MIRLIVGLGLLAICSSAAWAQGADDAPRSLSDNAPPTAEKCAAVYGAFAQDQANFGSSDSLLGERYRSYAKINFDERLTQMAGKAAKNPDELKDATQADRSAFYMKLVDAETEGNMDAQSVHEMIRLSDSCDAEFGFSPSMGD